MAGLDFDLGNVLRFEPGYDMLNRWVFILDKKLVLELVLLHRYDVSDLNFTINGNIIQFVDSYKHLGHVINSDLTDDIDILEKRAVFIGQANNIICYFANLNAAV